MNGHKSRAVPGLPAPHHDEEWAEQEVHKLEKDEPVTTDISPLSKDELMNEILTVHHALCDTGNAVTTDPNTQAVGVRP